MMLERKVNIKKSELLTLLSWLKSENIMNNKKFKFDYLLNECFNDDSGDVEVLDFLDDLMAELFEIYEKLKIKSPSLESHIMESPLFKVLPKDMIDESMRSMKSFLDLYEHLLMDCKFENNQMRGIQKTMITVLLNKYISDEEYEKCIELKEKLKNI